MGYLYFKKIFETLLLTSVRERKYYNRQLLL